MTEYEIITLSSAWLIGMLTQAIINDSAAITQCKITLLDLEESLQYLNYLRQHPKTNHEYLEQINNIRIILTRLDMHHSGLIIKNCDLQQLLEESLQKIYHQKKDPEYGTSNYVIDLLTIWDKNIDSSFEFLEIKKLQKQFFYVGLVSRFIWRYGPAFPNYLLFLFIFLFDFLLLTAPNLYKNNLIYGMLEI